MNNNKTIAITNANDELLICLMQIKGTEPIFKDVNGRLFIDRNRFILHTD